MAPLEFIPQHSQPFTLEQAMQLEVDVLSTEITRLQNSIQHLEMSQKELEEFIVSDRDADSDGELAKAIKENEQVISSQRERILIIRLALVNKVGEGGAKHYGFVDDNGKKEGHGDTASRAVASQPVGVTTATVPVQHAQQGQMDVDEEPQDGGVHL